MEIEFKGEGRGWFWGRGGERRKDEKGGRERKEVGEKGNRGERVGGRGRGGEKRGWKNEEEGGR